MFAKHSLLLLPLLACASTTTRKNLPPLATVEQVDLERYTGTWFEIASFPEPYQRGCFATRATYTPKADGSIEVRNRCDIDKVGGDVKQAIGTARVVDAHTHAKLEVNFFGPFWGDYWVIALDPNYTYAMVGHPSRDHLWILSRTPKLDLAVYNKLRAQAVAQGYDVERLQLTVH